MKLTFVTTVYKIKEDYLRESIESLLNQTEQDFELLIVDDGTPDNGGEVADEYAAKDSRIRVIHQENSGVSVARNRGIDEANAPWITFIDGDDWVDPEFCAKTMKAVEELDPDILFTGMVMHWSTKEKTHPFYDKCSVLLGEEDRIDLETQIIARNYARFVTESHTVGATWAKVYRTSFLREKKLYYNPKLRRSQDVVFNVWAINAAGSMAYIDEYLYHYRKSDSSAMRRYIANAAQYQRLVLEEFARYVDTKPEYPVLKKALTYRTVNVLFSLMNNDYFNKDNPKSYSERKAELLALLDEPLFKDALDGISASEFPRERKILVTALKHRNIMPLRLYYSAKNKLNAVMRYK
ncbi:MAG: glycosyltransferase [Lachnospiraceae bacterium]|nr:glycosyltransferase [Lachnospiraceae bacterium]